MTMLNATSRDAATRTPIWRRADILLSHIGHLINRWIAAAIARHERQADLYFLHQLSDRELKDIGLTRDELDHIAGHRAVDVLRDGTTHFWIRSRGVM